MKKILVGMVFLTLLLTPAMVLAADEKANEIVKTYEAWLKKNQVKKGAIAVSYRGEIVASGGRGRNVDELAPVASLSKAITATCVTHALKAFDKKLFSPLSELIGNYIKGKKAPPANRGLFWRS